MKRLRKHPLFLLAIALALPLGIAFLYYDFYDGNDLVRHPQLSMADNEDLTNFLRKNPRVFVAADALLQPPGLNLIETASFHLFNPVSTARKSAVLRC